jgi:hypothetical protein
VQAPGVPLPIMDLTETNEQAPDWALMSDRVVADAKRLYGSLVNDVVLEQRAREATAEIWTDSIKVTHFVPVLALRRVREQLAEAGELASLQQVAGNRTPQTNA